MAGAIPAVSQPDDRNYKYLCQKYSNSLRNDERLKAMLLYRAELIQCLVPEELLDHMALLLSNEKIEQIKCTRKNCGDISASRQLLDALLECGEPNLYTTFLDILQRSGHEKALGLMQGIRRIQSEEVFEQVINLMRDGIVNYLVVNVELLNELVAAGCITEKTKGVIQTSCDSNCRQAAASVLLDQIKKFIRKWPREFVRALKSTGNESVVELLSPDFLDPNKDIDDVLDDLGAANKAVIPEDPPHLGQDATDSSFSIPHDGVTSQIINQTAINEGSGNFNLAVGGLAQVTINSTVNVVSPTSSLESEASAPPANVVTDVRTEIVRVDSSDDVSANCLDAPQRNDNILGMRNITLTSNLDKNKNLSQNVTQVSMDSQEAEASVREKNDDEHSEKQDTESTKEKEKTELELYDFQKTLARPGIEGKNTIICAPTGSGKTIIAAGIMKDHLKNNPGKHKVIFLACEVALANQQNKQFEKFLGPEFKSFVISGGAESGDKVPPIKMLLCDYDIIVLTAQILVNAMTSPKATKFDNEMDLVKFSDFSLMVFDECHHTGSDHPYNRIMSKYVDQKLSGITELPQVIGLTASLGVGKASSMSQAIEHVVTMCANLDATVLSNPDEAMMEQIHETANTPVMNTTVAKSRDPDPFQDNISCIMSEIEKKLKKNCEGENKAFMQIFTSIPPEKGNQPYIQWSSRIQKLIESSTTLPGLNRQRSLLCLSYLKSYNQALLINHECRTRDALEFLREEFREHGEVRVRVDEDSDGFFDSDEMQDEEKDAEQAWLEERFNSELPDLLEISINPRYKNPMLEELKGKILEKFPTKESKRAGRIIIFVQTREMTLAICRWIAEDDDLKDLNPHNLVGANAKDAGPATMTQTKQLNILDYFKSGEHKLLVATSVAEEGLDIQKCNLIIRYNYVTNEIAMVQSRGRARAENSTYEVVTGGALGSKKARKEDLNKIRERMMVRAIEDVKKMRPDVYAGHIRSFQEKSSKERKIMAMARQRKKTQGNQMGPYYLLCRWCIAPLCTSVELRLLAGLHHAVISESFKDKYVTDLNAKPKIMDAFEFRGKISCCNCYKQLGVFALYRKVPFPLLKASNILIENAVRDENNKIVLENNKPTMDRKGYKQWKDVPFSVHEITDDELKTAMSAVDGTEDSHECSEPMQ